MQGSAVFSPLRAPRLLGRTSQRRYRLEAAMPRLLYRFLLRDAQQPLFALIGYSLTPGLFRLADSPLLPRPPPGGVTL